MQLPYLRPDLRDLKRLREEWSESIFISGGLYENLRFYEFRKKKPVPVMQD